MTVPAHPDCRQLLAALTATDPGTADLVHSFPSATDPRHLAATLTLWQRLAEHAPACSVLADCWITADAGPTGVGIDAVAVSVDHPDRTVGAHVIPGACAHGFPQVVGPCCCSTRWPPLVSWWGGRAACSVGSSGRS